jgi:hypothetical protein
VAECGTYAGAVRARWWGGGERRHELSQGQGRGCVLTVSASASVRCGGVMTLPLPS